MSESISKSTQSHYVLVPSCNCQVSEKSGFASRRCYFLLECPVSWRHWISEVGAGLAQRDSVGSFHHRSVQLPHAALDSLAHPRVVGPPAVVSANTTTNALFVVSSTLGGNLQRPQDGTRDSGAVKQQLERCTNRADPHLFFYLNLCDFVINYF